MTEKVKSREDLEKEIRKLKRVNVLLSIFVIMVVIIQVYNQISGFIH